MAFADDLVFLADIKVGLQYLIDHVTAFLSNCLMALDNARRLTTQDGCRRVG